MAAWTKAQEEKLKELYQRGYRYKEISKKMNKSVPSIRNKIWRTFSNGCKVDKEYREEHKEYYKEYNKEYGKKYREENKEKKKEYQKKYMPQYMADNPEKFIRKQRYSTEYQDIAKINKYYNYQCCITGKKTNLQVHHTKNIKHNKDFWETATFEEKKPFLKLINADVHKAYHTWNGGTRQECTPESFDYWVKNVYKKELNKQKKITDY